MSSGFELTTATELRLEDLPSDEQVIAVGRELLEATNVWKKGRAYQKNTVQTYFRPKGPRDGASWHCRVSEHTPAEVTFDELWNKIGKDHAENEKEYLEVVKKATLAKKISAAQEIWSMYYEFRSMGISLSPRVFTTLQVTHYDDSSSPRTGIFISIPVDLSGDPELAKIEGKEVVKGRYASVECIKELPNGNTEWRMATSSSPGGRIPAFIVDNTMPGFISADVSSFLGWFRTIRHGVEDKERPTAISVVPSVTSPIEGPAT